MVDVRHADLLEKIGGYIKHLTNGKFRSNEGGYYMNELIIFNNPEFGTVRTLEGSGDVLFCAKDVATALAYRIRTQMMQFAAIAPMR